MVELYKGRHDLKDDRVFAFGEIWKLRDELIRLLKAFKAYYVYLKEEIPPFTHSLIKVSQNEGFYDSITEELKDIIDILEPLNIEARYPSQKDKLFSELTEIRCNTILLDMEVLYRWITDKFTKESIDL